MLLVPLAYRGGKVKTGLGNNIKIIVVFDFYRAIHSIEHLIN